MISVVRVGIVIAVVLQTGCGGGGGSADGETLPGKQATYTVGGAISGLTITSGQTAPAIRIDNVSQMASAMQSVTVNGNGSFTFPAVPSGTPYELAITSPPGHLCIFDAGSANGRVENASIANHNITCTIGEYSVGGAVSGLGLNNPGLQLSLIVGGQSTSLSLSTDGLFTFPNPRLTTGTPYSVSMSVPHSHYVCTLNGGSGSVVGTMGSSNVTNIAANCAAPVRVSVSGLAANSPGLVLSNSYTTDANTPRVAETLSIPGNVTAFPFATRLPSGRQYAVSISALHPDYNCSVVGGSGTVGTMVIDVPVVCQPVPTISYIGGSLSDGSENVQRAYQYTAEFSGQLDASTINSSNVALTSQYGTETISVASFFGTGILITPSRPLRRLTAYTLTISTGLHGTSNRARLAAPVAIHFTTADEPAWLPPTQISSVATDAAMPIDSRIGFDGNGNAIVTWSQSVGGEYESVVATRYSSATGTWNAPALIESSNLGATFDPQLAVSANGHAHAIWRQSNGTEVRIWSNHYDPAAQAWGSATQVAVSNTGSPYAARIASDANGNAVAIWSEYDGSTYKYWWNSYSIANSSWRVPALFDGDGLTSIPHAVSAGAGIMAVFTRSDGARSSVWSSRFDAVGGSWESAQLVENENTGSASGPRLAVNKAGDAIAWWSHSFTTRNATWMNRYVGASNTWGAAIELPSGSSASQMAVDSSGNAIAVWTPISGSTTDLKANRYAAASNSWSSALTIESAAGSASDPQIAMDANANAIVVWQQSGIGRVLWNRYSLISAAWNGERWAAAGTQTSNSPQIASAPDGTVFAIWQQTQDGRTTLWVSRFE